MKDISYAEEKLILSKANDTISLSLLKKKPCFYGFLNEHEAQLIKDNINNKDVVFWGGYEDAQRVFLGVRVTDENEFPFSALKITFKKDFTLSHRDFLGALMALGLERAAVGDILVYEGEAIVFIKSSLLDYVINQLDVVGRVGVHVCVCDINDIEYQPKFELMLFTVSSLRLDVFVSAVCNLSRTNSQKLINMDAVRINHTSYSNPSKLLSTGDVVTIKKYGKFAFIDDFGTTKKGRLRITVKHFR